MCFSAQASFAVTGLLSIIGVSTLFNVTSKRLLPFAMIPLIFALQQATEGLTWMSLVANPSSSNLVTVYVFLFFACIIWPTWIPASLYLIEHNPARKKLILMFLILGVTLSTLTFWELFHVPLNARVIGHHIHYAFVDETFKLVMMFKDILVILIYLLSTVIVFFVSTIPLMWTLGAIFLLFHIISVIFFIQFIGSVWCFFGAAGSVVVYFIVAKYKHLTTLPTIKNSIL